MMNTIRNLIGVLFFAIAAIPLIVAIRIMTPDLRRKITRKVLENF